MENKEEEQGLNRNKGIHPHTPLQTGINEINNKLITCCAVHAYCITNNGCIFAWVHECMHACISIAVSLCDSIHTQCTCTYYDSECAVWRWGDPDQMPTPFPCSTTHTCTRVIIIVIGGMGMGRESTLKGVNAAASIQTHAYMYILNHVGIKQSSK